MIVIDASAIVAILNREAGHEALLPRFLAHRQRCLTPISALEIVMVLSRKYADPAHEVEVYLRQEHIAVHPIDRAQSDQAQQAFLLYGKGRHRARLNLSDCFSYAAAKTLNAPLLYIGDDFAMTDIQAA